MNLLYVLIALLLAGLLVYLFTKDQRSSEDRSPEPEDADWAYGDAWKQGSPDSAVPPEEEVFVEVMRFGGAYKDSDLMEMVHYLGSRGIRATFDAHSVAMEMAPMKSYVLKVESGKIEEAKACLKERLSQP